MPGSALNALDIIDLVFTITFEGCYIYCFHLMDAQTIKRRAAIVQAIVQDGTWRCFARASDPKSYARPSPTPPRQCGLTPAIIHQSRYFTSWCNIILTLTTQSSVEFRGFTSDTSYKMRASQVTNWLRIWGSPLSPQV